MQRRSLSVVIGLVGTLALSGCGLAQSQPEISSGLTRAEVVRVIDGDTIVAIVHGTDERVRFIGIDTPERGEAGFEEATAFTQDAIDDAGGTVYFEQVGADRDRYQRLRRNIWLAIPTDFETQRHELLLNQRLLDAGLAVVWGSGNTDASERFQNCTQVWEVLGRPIREGEPGFHSGLDGDNDGIGCETRPR